jgi:hypothetical protein
MVSAEIKPLTMSFGPLIPSIAMGEYKAKTNEPTRLLLRLESPVNEPMVVEVKLEHDFLERLWKLMLICEKIRVTMQGRAKVIIENACCHFVSIHSEAPIQRLLAKAKVKEWNQLHSLWVPSDFLLGNLGVCRAVAGMRGSQTIVNQDGLWFEGSDGTHYFSSVRSGKGWVKQQLDRYPP